MKWVLSFQTVDQTIWGTMCFWGVFIYSKSKNVWINTMWALLGALCAFLHLIFTTSEDILLFVNEGNWGTERASYLLEVKSLVSCGVKDWNPGSVCDRRGYNIFSLKGIFLCQSSPCYMLLYSCYLGQPLVLLLRNLLVASLTWYCLLRFAVGGSVMLALLLAAPSHPELTGFCILMRIEISFVFIYSFYVTKQKCFSEMFTGFYVARASRLSLSLLSTGWYLQRISEL